MIRGRYTDADLDAILASVTCTPQTNRADRWVVDVLIRGAEIEFSEQQLDRVLEIAGRVWEQQPGGLA